MKEIVKKICDFLVDTFNFVENEDFKVNENKILLSGGGECRIKVTVSQHYSKSFAISWSGNNIIVDIGSIFEDWALLEVQLRGFGVRPKQVKEETEEEGW